MPSPLNSPTGENIPRSLYDAFADIGVLDGKRNGNDTLSVVSPYHGERTCCSPISTTSGSNSSCSIHHDHETEYSCESLDKSSSIDSTDSVSTTSVLPARSNLGSIRYRRAKLNLNLLPLSIGIGSAPDIVSSTQNGSGNNDDNNNNNTDCDRQIVSQNELQLPIDGHRKNRLSMNFYLNKSLNLIDAVQIDINVPIEHQRFFHGFITRTEAEIMLESNGRVGAYLVRICDPRTRSYSISLKSFRGFMHIRVKKDDDSSLYSLCQNRSSPDQFESVPELIQFYTCNRLPISGAEFMSFVFPIEAQLL